MDVENLNTTQSTEVSVSFLSSPGATRTDSTPETQVDLNLQEQTDKSSNTVNQSNPEKPNDTEEESIKPEKSPPIVSSSDSNSDSNEASENGTLSPLKSIEVTQSILDAKRLVDSISRCLSEAKSDREQSDTMVQGNGAGIFASQNVASESVARYFALPSVNNNMKAALALGNSNLKCPSIVQKKENAFQRDYSCENRNTPSESTNSDEDDDVEIVDDDDNEDWSFDEDDDEAKTGKQCPCAFKPQANENGNKTPLKRQDCNLDSPGTSRSQLQSNPFFLASIMLQCPDCEQSFNCRVDLNRHRLKHIADKSFRCSHCDKSFAFSFNLKSHERQHTGEKPYVCNECGLSFVHAFYFHEHRRVHNIRSHFVCSICLKSFNMESKYLLHIRRHSSIKPFKCNMCGKTFQRAAGLRSHELLHTVEKEDQTYSCRFCERTFVHIMHKQMHERVHLGEKLFHCLRCKTFFTDLNQLKAHACVTFKCNICKEAFPSLALLESHNKSHFVKKSTHKSAQVLHSKFNTYQRRSPLVSAKKRFPCKLCSQAFSTKRLLEDHGKIHQREYTPFMCQVCSLTFTHSNYLKLHLSTHEGGGPFQAADSPKSMHIDFKELPQILNLQCESPLSSPRSRQSSGEQSSSSSPIDKSSPPIRIKNEPV